MAASIAFGEEKNRYVHDGIRENLGLVDADQAVNAATLRNQLS